MVKRQKVEEVEAELPQPLPTPEEIAEAIRTYLTDPAHRWSWRDLQKESGVNHRVLRKMLDPEQYNVWYKSAEQFWKFHCKAMRR